MRTGAGRRQGTRDTRALERLLAVSTLEQRDDEAGRECVARTGSVDDIHSWRRRLGHDTAASDHSGPRRAEGDSDQAHSAFVERLVFVAVGDHEIGPAERCGRNGPGRSGVEAEEAGGLPGRLVDRHARDLELAEDSFAVSHVDVRRPERSVRSGCDDDRGLPRRVHGDDRDAGRCVDDVDVDPDSGFLESAKGLPGEFVVPDAAPEGDLRAKPRRRDCLVRSLAARPTRERRAGNGLAYARETVGTNDEVEVDRADDGELGARHDASLDSPGMGLAHWDEVDSHRAAKGEMDAVWQRLGAAAGTKGVGLNRVRVEPGKLSTPPHVHSVSEEAFFVLSGSGLAWQDGAVYEVRPNDCVIHQAADSAHTFIAGPDGLEYVVFGTLHPTEVAWLPRSRAVRMGHPWVEGRDDHPWDVEANAPLLEYGKPAPRPASIVNVDEVEQEVWEGRVTESPLATHERSKLAGLHWQFLHPGRRGCVPHCHALEEEIFIILDGTATLELWPSPVQTREGKTVEDTPLRAGHVVARPPGTRISHSFRAGPDGVTMLVYGTREANDICWYPRSQKIFWRGVGVIGRVEQFEYFDGEPVEDD